MKPDPVKDVDPGSAGGSPGLNSSRTSAVLETDVSLAVSHTTVHDDLCDPSATIRITTTLVCDALSASTPAS